MILKFGTSGVRGLVEDLTNDECYRYTTAYLKYLDKLGLLNGKILIAGDLRPSTDRIMKAVATAIKEYGQDVINCGKVATPVISYYGFTNKIPGIMVTGSHIPFDRNGIKFNMPEGEVLKVDEKGISDIYQSLEKKPCILTNLPEVTKIPAELFINRFKDFFDNNLLKEKTIVVYQHSSVIRDMFPEILENFGAEVIKVGFSDKFIALDTESPTKESFQVVKESIEKYHPDAIISFDGDGDRPLFFDKNGNFIRGDILGIICAKFLKADSVSCPVSCNTALEKSDWFKNIKRTKIGSPFVIQSMNEMIQAGFKRVVAYEANGGFLTASEIDGLLPLPSRDSVLPILAVLATGTDIIEQIPKRYTYCHTIKKFETKKSLQMIKNIKDTCQKLKITDIKNIDYTDGARITLENNNVIHFRPSGNAPELRCYTETNSEKKSKELAEIISNRILQL